jgi:hypothetical protein
MSAIWESANWTRQFGIRQTGTYTYYAPLNVMCAMRSLVRSHEHI